MSSPHDQFERFPPNPAFLVPPFAVAGIALAATAWFAPVALLFAWPVLGLTLALVSLGNAGVILTPDGIEWYALHPRWRFRKVPWDAILEVRKGFFGIGNRIRLIVRSGRYEPWVWGTPRPDRQIDIEIHPVVLRRGEDLLEAIRGWLARRDESAASDRALLQHDQLNPRSSTGICTIEPERRP